MAYWQQVTLFLDFDGCLHGEAMPHFCRLPGLEALLREPQCRHVRIVISSAWREGFPLEELRRFFAADLRTRIVGATPVIEERRRCAEIEAYLRAHPRIGAFIVLDDCGEEWPPGWPVVAPDPQVGLTRRDLDDLRRLIKALPGSA